MSEDNRDIEELEHIALQQVILQLLAEQDREFMEIGEKACRILQRSATYADLFCALGELRESGKITSFRNAREKTIYHLIRQPQQLVC